MYAGIDFGTSNCAVGIWQDNQPALLKLEAQRPLLSSAIFTYRSEDFGFSNNQTIGDAIAVGNESLFGEQAVQQYMDDPESGFYVKSPKSFLGAEVGPAQIKQFTHICTRMLTHLKAEADSQTEHPIDSIVLGRPVNFQSAAAGTGNEQAVEILEAASARAGFKHVELMFEPIAAALDYERSIDKDTTALVLDAGGGTTDCSMVQVGPSFRNQHDRNQSILGYAGDRIGGIDLDISLADRVFMPHFGKNSGLVNGNPVPLSVFWDAITVNDVTAQARFYSYQNTQTMAHLGSNAAEPEKLRRLLALHDGNHSYRICRSAEQAKMGLSDQPNVNALLDYIEPDLSIGVSQEELGLAIHKHLKCFLRLMNETVTQAGTQPDVIYVTGGTAKSPILQAFIRQHFADTEIIIGNHFGSVTSGLTTEAKRLYG